MSFEELHRANQLLQAALAEKDAVLAEREAALADRDARIEQLARDLALLTEHVKRLLAGRGGAHLIAEGQGVLFPDAPAPDEAPEHADEAPDGETTTDRTAREPRSKRPARRIDTSALPRSERVHELPEDERVCPHTGLTLVPVGEKTFEEIDYQRARLAVVVHRQIVYGLPPELAVQRKVPPLIAPLPARALDLCAASPYLLAWIIVQKYRAHLPLHRQEELFARDGLRLPRQTLCDWVLAAAELLAPIVEHMAARIRAGPVMQLDDTPVMCQGGKDNHHFQAYLWTFVNPEVEGVVYRFTPGRGSDLIAELLADFIGTLLGDGYSGNKAAARKALGAIILAGCWAHTTRTFRDAEKEVPGSAKLFRDDIKRLYAIEDLADEQGLEPDARRELRQQQSRPIVDALMSRGQRLRDQFSDAGTMGKAIGYLLNQEAELRRFLDDGRVPIDNNRCERSIRPIAVGRRNWLFAGSVRGGHAAAILYTLVESCRLAEVDMLDYFADVLVRVNTHPASRIDELVPANWAKTLDRERRAHAPAAELQLA